MSSDSDLPPVAKKAKTDDGSNTRDGDIHLNLKDLEKFKFCEMLKEDPVKKTLALKANVDGSTESAVILLEKSAFTEEYGKEILESKTPLKQTFHNGIYGNYTGFPKQELNGVKVTIIHPATGKHILKYTAQELVFVDETPQMYKSFQGHPEGSAFNVQWVHNILEHRSETERIVCEDTDPETGFVLVPDLKWDGESLESLYLMALVHRRDLRSIRDLTADHLPLLRNIWTKGAEAIEKKYGVPPSELRVYFHYLPSYYHLHVHFTSVQFDAPGTHVGKAHFMSSVINNIELVPDYYQRATLTCRLPRAQLDNFKRRNCVIINGVPEKPGEKTDSLVVDIGMAAGVDLSADSVDSSDRLGQPQHGKPRPIKAKFESFNSRQKFYNNRNKLSAQRLSGHPTLTRAVLGKISISECLSPESQHLLFVARQLQKKKLLRAAYTTLGRVKVRKAYNSAVKTISEIGDFEELVRAGALREFR